MKLSVVIPAHNEQDNVGGTVRALHDKLTARAIEHELLVVNDNSTDRTAAVLATLGRDVPTLRVVDNDPPNGFGFAVRCGLERYTGDAVAIYMADGSDSPEDLVHFFDVLRSREVECVFGSRFTRESTVVDYPRLKLVLNRSANALIRLVFGFRYNDVTNAFKLYRREVIDGLRPIISHHFNITVELPLKAIIRGYRYAVVPNDWFNRKTGESKLHIREMGGRYLFIVLYCLLEKWLSRGDYHRARQEEIVLLRRDGTD